jgi:putative transposase
MPRKSRIDAAGALHHIIARGIARGKIFKVCEILQLRSTELWAPGKQRRRMQARSLFCYWACRELEISMAALFRKLNISESALSLSVKRGEKLAQEKGYSLI